MDRYLKNSVAMLLAVLPVFSTASLWNEGDIIVGDLSTANVIKVDPISGTQTVISSGGLLVQPGGFGFDADGDLILADLKAFGGPCPIGCGGVIRIDRQTGFQSVISSGGNFINPFGLVVESTGNIVVSEEGGSSAGKILRINPSTGAQFVLSADPVFRDPLGLALDAQANILVSEGSAGGGGLNGSVVLVDPSSGSASVLSGGGMLVSPWGIALDQTTGIYLTEPGGKKIVRIDSVTFAQSLVSSGGVFVEPTGIGVDSAGGLLVADRTQIVRINPVGGGQTILSAGGDLVRLGHLIVVPTMPELLDVDQDGIPDESDNCPLQANPLEQCTSGSDCLGPGNSCDINAGTCALQDDNDGDGAGDVCDADDDNDGVQDIGDNCPIAPNSGQEDSDFDGLGDACDSTFNNGSAADQVETDIDSAIDVIVDANPPGANGLVSKLINNGGVSPIVANAVAAFDGGFINLSTYLHELNRALAKLDSFDNQLHAKISNGQIAEPDASSLVGLSNSIRTTIEVLITNAM